MKSIFCFLILLIIPLAFKAQVEKVIVETYYVSDANDASDTTGGKLPVGSKTYRIYIDLVPGSKLKKIYGDANHTLKIQSDSVFFNHTDRGQSFGNQFNINHFRENNAALDTWLTLGQLTKTGAKTYFGILKVQDTDGNLIAGSNNYDGLLVNSDISAGIPLTSADGIDTMLALPTSWADFGIREISGDDSTIFGSLKSGSKFISNYAGLQNSGVSGVVIDSNQVLVAQLTTTGEISFELNVAVEEPDGIGTKTVYYVANDSILLANEKLSRHLKYPFVQICGCADPDFVEYKEDRDCDRSDSCKTRIVFGCMDTSACNYDPNATFNISQLCCYPGYCNDRDLNVVCPGISNSVGFIFYPNPVLDQLTMELSGVHDQEVAYEILNSFDKVVLQKNQGVVSDKLIQQVDVSYFDPGLYLLRIVVGGTTQSKLFMKS